MRKKPSLHISKEKRLKDAKKELDMEKISTNNKETTQTTIIIETNLLYSAKEVALKRKKAGVKPNTITGIVRQALKDIVEKEINK